MIRMISWLLFGYELARLILTVGVSLLAGALLFKRFVSPKIHDSLLEAGNTITSLAKLGGIKSQEFKDTKHIEKLVAEDFIKNKIPELELVKAVVSPGTWEDIQETIENNPAAIIDLWDKYGHYFTEGKEQQSSRFDFE